MTVPCFLPLMKRELSRSLMVLDEMPDVIIDATTVRDGHDAVFCEGARCNNWIHRRCAGLSTSAFKVISSPSNRKQPFYCPTCRLDMHGKEIDALKAAIQNLSLSVAKLQSQPCVTPLAPASPNINQISSEIIPTKPTISKSTLQHPVDSKFNLVIYGIKEHPKGTQRHIRSTQDLDTVTSILSSLHPSIAHYSVRDCTRLGKFSESRCRPILCTMSRSIDVSAVLTNRSLLSQKHRDIFIKPYLTSEARKAETILLKQRRELITSGISSKTIKLRDNSLFINGRKHGTVIDSSYQTYPLLSDYVSDPPAPVSPNLSPGTCTSSTQQNISRSTSSSVLINTSVSQAINTSTDSSNIPQPVSVQLDTPIPDPINTSPLISNPADLTNR